MSNDVALPPGWDETLARAKAEMSGNKPAPQTPSIGRTVHYVAAGTTECVAAIITQVLPEPTEGNPVGRCQMVVFSADRPTPMFRNADLVPAPGIDSWHWPERVG